MSAPQKFIGCDQLFKLVIVGDCYVGNTSILERYVHGTFSDVTKVDPCELLYSMHVTTISVICRTVIL